jgi:glycosyltransferase involved in cell wall biosynthesis
MKLSIFTTITNPHIRGDNLEAALACYLDLADEVVIIDGTENPSDIVLPDSPKIRRSYYPWPKEFNWPFIGEQFQRGYEQATGDWVIHCDLDFLFHENDFNAIRKACERNSSSPALTFYKHQFIQPSKYNLKSRLVLAANKGEYSDRIRFDSGGDLCQPSLDGQYIEPGTVPEAKIPFYNYEKITKNKTQVMDDVGRMDRAWNQFHGKYIYGDDGSDEAAFKGWIDMMRGRYDKPQMNVPLRSHPKYMIPIIEGLSEEQFGGGGWGLL